MTRETVCSSSMNGTDAKSSSDSNEHLDCDECLEISAPTAPSEPHQKEIGGIEFDDMTPHLLLDPQYFAAAEEEANSDADHPTMINSDPYASASVYRRLAQKEEEEEDQSASSSLDDPTSQKKQLRVYRVDGRPYIPSWRIHSSLDDASLHDAIRSIAAAILWLQQDNKTPEPAATIRQLSVERVLGGVTNTLYKVSGFHSPDAVLVRLFGAAGLIDRDAETAVFAALSQQQLAPAYYGRFANGRVEGYRPGRRPLQVSELPRHGAGIAARLAQLHAQFRIRPLLRPTERQQPTLWRQLLEWLDPAEVAMAHLPISAEDADDMQLSKVRDELTWLQEQVQNVVDGDDEAIVFCHNDLLAANILYDDATDTIELIDFEYGGINYRAFDIANHLNEYAGGPPTDCVPRYEDLPDDEQQRRFIRSYLETAASILTTQPPAVSDAVVETLLREVQLLSLANHLYWGLWAVNQAATEGCATYDYLTYAICRIRQYWKTRRTVSSVVE